MSIGSLVISEIASFIEPITDAPASCPATDIAVDARAVFDAVDAIDACEPQEGSLKFHLIPVRDRLAQGIIRRMHWVDTRDMLAEGLANGGIDRALLHNVSDGCSFKLAHEAFDSCQSFRGLHYQLGFGALCWRTTFVWTRGGPR